MYKGAKYFNELVTSGKFNEDTLAIMHRIEHEGDAISREISEMLNRTFITPFDREDIYMLSNNIDNVLDSVDAITKRMGLYKLTQPDHHLKQFSVIIEQASSSIVDAVKLLDNMKHSSRIQAYCSEINRLENMSDHLRDIAIGELFEKNSDPIFIIKWKEIYETAENTVDTCDYVGKTIYSIIVKQA
jgi:predicted phosphate transport protein (TIGR00153 family)